MQDLVARLKSELTLKLIKFFLVIVSIPIIGYIINLFIMMFYNLGRFSGIFIRNLYNFVS